MEPIDINLALLGLLQRAVVTGDARVLALTNLSEDQMVKLRDMTGADLVRLAGCNMPFLKIAIEPTFGRLLAQTTYDVVRMRKIERLILTGASYPCVKALCGWENSEFTYRRTLLGLPGVPGRPVRPSPEQELRIRELWAALSDLEIEDRLYDIHLAVKVPVASIWNVIQEHDAEERTRTVSTGGKAVAVRVVRRGGNHQSSQQAEPR